MNGPVDFARSAAHFRIMQAGVLYPRSKAEVDEIIADMERVRGRAMKSRRTARAYLRKLGIVPQAKSAKNGR